MVGSAIVRTLIQQGVPAQAIITRTHAELDLCNQAAVQAFFTAERPTQVYLAAAKVGGIHANNTYPADFIYDNLMMQANIMAIDVVQCSNRKKSCFMGLPNSQNKNAQQTKPLGVRQSSMLTCSCECGRGWLCQTAFQIRH